MGSDLGKQLIAFGIVIIVIGLLVMYSDKLPSLGRLPGDIVFERENFRFYFPITTSILVSVILTVIYWAVSKFRS